MGMNSIHNNSYTSSSDGASAAGADGFPKRAQDTAPGKPLVNLLEVLVFAVLVTFLLSRSYDALRYKNTGNGGGLEGFYETDVPIDVIAYGSSHAACTINNGILWDEYGIASATLGAASQSVDGTYYFLKETLRVNKPRVAWIETYRLPEEGDEMDGLFRSTLTSRFSLNYVDYIIRTARNKSFDRKFTEELMLRMPIVHTRYRELTRDDFVIRNTYNRGYWGDDYSSPQPGPEMTDERGVLSESSVYYIDRMIDLCEKNDVLPIFFCAPYNATADEVMRQNALSDHLAGRGMLYVDFNRDAAAYGIDFETDMREYTHLNDAGAAKITRALADMTLGLCELPDRRGEAGYEMWDTNLRFLADRKDTYQLSRSDELPDYLTKLGESDGDYTVIVSLNGYYRALGDEAYAAQLEGIGIDRASYEQGGVWVIRNGSVDYWSEGSDEYEYLTVLDNGVDLCLYKDSGEDPHIYLDGEEYEKPHNGVSMIIYDDICSYIVDTGYTDVFSGLQVIHDRESFEPL